jgi:hypothetical protein
MKLGVIIMYEKIVEALSLLFIKKNYKKKFIDMRSLKYIVLGLTAIMKFIILDLRGTILKLLFNCIIQ